MFNKVKIKIIKKFKGRDAAKHKAKIEKMLVL